MVEHFVYTKITLVRFWHSLLKYHTLVILTLWTIIPILIAVAFFTLAERKIMAFIQRRKGPDVVGFWGLLQPIADALKLIIAEPIILSNSEPYLFLLAPSLPLIFGLSSWSIIPFSYIASHNNSTINILYLFPISMGSVYGIILAGWASNSKYAILGSFRSVSQILSYDISMLLCTIPIILLSGSLNLFDIILAQSDSCWFFIPLLPLSVIFFITMLAETNRAPFDLPEAEAELVAGFNVEYSSVIFAFFFLGEYSNMILMSTLIVLFFFGGFSLVVINQFLLDLFIYDVSYIISGDLIFCIKISFFCFLFVLVRANFPRYRYDQLMQLGWKILLPLTLAYIIFTCGLIFTFNGFNNIYIS